MHFIRRTLTITALALTVGLTGLGTPSVAGADLGGSRPDALIRLPGGQYLGDGIYNTTGAPGQEQSTIIERGSSATWEIKIQNDGAHAAAFRIQGTAGNAAFGAKYLRKGKNVTAAVVNGTYTTPTLAPGKAITLKLTLKVKSNALPGASGGFYVRAKGASVVHKADTVRATPYVPYS